MVERAVPYAWIEAAPFSDVRSALVPESRSWVVLGSVASLVIGRSPSGGCSVLVGAFIFTRGRRARCDGNPRAPSPVACHDHRRRAHHASIRSRTPPRTSQSI